MKRDLVLVVEDDGDVAAMLGSVLEPGCHLVTVRGGRRALRLAGNESIRFAVLGDYDGAADAQELLRELRRRVPGLPVIVISESATKGSIIRAFRMGASDFLEKPLDRACVETACSRALSTMPSRIGLTGPSSSTTGLEPGPLPSLQPSPRRSPGVAGLLRRSVLSIRKAFRPADERGRSGRAPEDPAVPSPHASTLQIYFFGKFCTILGGQYLDRWPSRKVKNLFAFLMYHHKRRHRRDLLMDRFWHNASPQSARNCLNSTVYRLRLYLHKFEPEHSIIQFRDECYFVNPALDLWLDVEAFNSCWREARALERDGESEDAMDQYELAAAFYSGDFMEAEIYESWPELDRETLKEQYLLSLDRLSRCYSGRGELSTAIDLCERILAKDRCREDIHQRLMLCYSRLNQRSRALKQFSKCRRALRQELDVGPSRATCEIYDRIRHDYMK